jgi:hypothetical protein
MRLFWIWLRIHREQGGTDGVAHKRKLLRKMGHFGFPKSARFQCGSPTIQWKIQSGWNHVDISGKEILN